RVLFRSLTGLNLQTTGVTDKGIETIQHLTKLSRVGLGSTSITDKSMDIIATWTNSVQMTLPITISPEGVRKLENAPYYSQLREFVNSTPMDVYVVDKSTGNALGNAEFMYQPTNNYDTVHFVSTDTDGHVRIYVPGSASAAKFRAFAPGYTTSDYSWPQPVPAESVYLELERGVSLGGIVKDLAGNPVAGAIVTIPVLGSHNWDSRENLMTTIETNSSGRWGFDGAPENPSDFWATVRHPDFGETRYDGGAISLDALHEGTQTFVLDPPVLLVGTVKNADGEAVPGARIGIKEPWLQGRNRITLSLTSDENGDFVVENPPKGELTITVVAEGYTVDSRAYSITESINEVSVSLTSL
ncbi:MAG: carboxypeptidase-like regulatory domain-containing protein, partial [Candidatus Hydrogenedentota bacterium]